MTRFSLVGTATILATLSVVAEANQPEIPALTRETAVGTWEALPNPEVMPKLLLRMEISKNESYLAAVLLGAPTSLGAPSHLSFDP
jgi:hypothetical protein